MKEKINTTAWKTLSVSLPVGITWTDFPSKKDCAVIVYCCGCSHGCQGCQNPWLQDPGSGTYMALDELVSIIIDETEKAHTNKVVLSGGDPYFQPSSDMNAVVSALVAKGYEVCVYTGANIENVRIKIPSATYYKCGKYDERNKEKVWGKFSDKMVFVSKNQALYNSEGKQISVDNVYYFNKWDTFKAKIRKWFKVK